MHRFRRAIAAVILALFCCQSVLAGIGEHMASSAHHAAGDARHDGMPAAGDDQYTPHPHAPAADLTDGDCCHAHGHCHLLAFTGPSASFALSLRHAVTVAPAPRYLSLPVNPLLRPPARV